jgi:hypothetical protein
LAGALSCCPSAEPTPKSISRGLGSGWRPWRPVGRGSRGTRPSRLLGPDSRRIPWTASPSEAGSDFAEDVVDAEGATAPFSVKTRACRIRSSCSVCLLRPPCSRSCVFFPRRAREAASFFLAVLAKLRLFSSCFEHLDSVGNRDVCMSESCFSRKGRVRYPYPRGVGIPRLGRPCRLRVLSPVHEALSPTQSRKLEGLLRQESFRTRRLVRSTESLYPSASYLSQKVMSEVSVSRRRRSPSARSALAAYVYSVVSRIRFPK